ncbi:MAG TPA: hypothetical protein VN253_29400 [Kofleriaceae bacterium]|nr:hypothetical protein [Kofleriaceae bacterium]
MGRSSKWLVLCLLVPSCSDGTSHDAMVPVDIDNGTCGDLVRFTGEYVDWDESGSSFCGVFGAMFRARDGGGMSSTAPNGRFDLCVPDQPITLVDITPPAQPSGCSSMPGSYSMPGIAVASKNVIFAGGFWSGRSFVVGRLTTDPTKAQVFVHVNGTPRPVSIGAAHGPAQTRTGTSWAPGDTGQDVFFPDVDPSGGQTTIMADRAIVPASIPLVAGTMTNVSIVLK